MHRIVPELIIENYRAGRRRGNFQAAGMFIDLSGFSTITDVLMKDERRGAEELTGLMYSVFDPLVKGVFEYGGKIVGFAGDGITAVYPVEEDLTSAARNALASAWSIQQRLASIASLQTPYGAFPISAKIGLACGEVSWGILSSREGGKATYYFRGGAVNESAEAEHQARPGEIVLAKSAYDQLQESVQSEPRGGFHALTGIGERLPEAHPVEARPVDLDIARVFIPEVVLTQDLRGEFRQVVNLFLRIPGLSDEGLQELIMTLFELQERYGGMISHMDFGDKGCTMLMMWGAPVTYENDIGRALNFAIDLKSAKDFPITAGITFHMAHAGYVGSALCEDYTCYGWGVNLAARFMTSARDGEIWVDERIVQRTSKRFNVEYVGEQNFKGFAEKQKVYALKGRKAAADPFYQGRLAGRDNELQKLANSVEPLWRGEYAGITAIWGEAGIGKSRLVHEFKGSGVFSDRENLWAVCQSDQVLRHSFNPFRYWLLRYFNISSSQDDPLRLESLNARLNELLADITDEVLIDELERARSFLAALVDLHWPDSTYERMDAQGRYDNTLLALIALLKAESLRRPLILLIEDAHYLDEDSKAFLSRLKRALLAGGPYPIALLVTSRWQADKTLVEEGFADHNVDLGGLSPEAMTSLSNDILGRPAGPDMIRLIEQRAEGNPFFAEQMLRYLQHESLLELNDLGEWAVRAGWKSSVLPADITTMLVARLDQLEPQVKDLVQTASVLGREFGINVLARMVREDGTLKDKVSQAERASIWAPLNELRYLFRHSLLRDAAYSMQLQLRRRRLHALALEALEGLYANEMSAHYPELAYHSEQAALTDRARLYLRRAADSARDAYQNAEALDYYSRTLILAASDELQERFNLLLERVMLYRRLGDRNGEAADVDQLDQLAGQLDDESCKARVYMLRAEYVVNAGDFQQAITFAEQAVDLAKQAGDEEVTVGAYLILPVAFLRQGKFGEAMGRAMEASRLAQAYARSSEEGNALNLMGLIALEQKEPVSARRYFEQALAIARSSTERALEAKSLNNLGNSAGFIEGDYAAARDYYEQALSIVQERGDRPAEGIALANLGWTAGMQGDFDSARSYQDKALAIAREIGDPYQEAYTLINLSAVAAVQGEVTTALRFANQAEELTVKIGDRSGQAWALLNKGHARLLGKDFEQAQEAYQRSAGIREELDQPSLATEPLAGLIQVALECGDISSAERWTEKILAHLEGGGTLDGTEEQLRIYLACYRTLEVKRDARSKDILQAAGKLLDAQVSKFRDDEARRRYVEKVPWRLAVQQAWEAARAA
jgi:class 3 adenylate cyclase/tetratricopeptide (TPR) repeat protein